MGNLIHKKSSKYTVPGCKHWSFPMFPEATKMTWQYVWILPPATTNLYKKVFCCSCNINTPQFLHLTPPHPSHLMFKPCTHASVHTHQCITQYALSLNAVQNLPTKLFTDKLLVFQLIFFIQQSLNWSLKAKKHIQIKIINHNHLTFTFIGIAKL